MKFFIDTADIREIEQAARLGLLDGVTTNPSLIAKVGGNRDHVLHEICRVVDGPVSGEVVAVQAEEMIVEGRALAKIHDNICVKIPITQEGLKAIKTLSDEKIKVNATLIFQPIQALLAAKAGAAFVSPFIGRLDDISQTGMELIHQVKIIFSNYHIETEVLVASIRHPMHVVEAAMIGADIATIPFPVIQKLLNHPLTDIGLEKFLNDWKKNKTT
ncbi:MAG: fructose-6-phosphate aldolase [Candidatus Cloacimonetes bacterium 4572_55]|nr:MAG: fructose-6-phosphate aldolase [Candidatus Cloacimonetes bacterium 4572_55]